MPLEISNGTNLAQVFAPLQAGMSQQPNTGIVGDDGVDVAAVFAPLVYGQRAANTGFQIADGRDLSDLFAAINTVVTTLPFDGKSYNTTVQGGSGQQGILFASSSFAVNTDGTYRASGSSSQSGGTTYGTGPIWSVGAPSTWEYRIYRTDGSYDSGWRSGTTATTVSVSASRNAQEQGETLELGQFVFESRRAGTTAVTATGRFTLRAGAYSWV